MSEENVKEEKLIPMSVELQPLVSGSAPS